MTNEEKAALIALAVEWANRLKQIIDQSNANSKGENRGDSN